MTKTNSGMNLKPDMESLIVMRGIAPSSRPLNKKEQSKTIWVYSKGIQPLWATTMSPFVMIDSGASPCFISREAVKTHKFHTYTLEKPKKLSVIHGREIASGWVTEACDMEFTIGNHKEILLCYIVELRHHHFILRMSWLKKHSATVEWAKGTVIFSSEFCHKNCLTNPVRITAGEGPADLNLSAISGLPDEYQDFAEVFTEDEEVPLPPHRPYDLGIELEPGSKPKWGPLYNLVRKEDDELKTSFERWIRQGYVRVSKSSMASPILFVKRKNGKYRMCVDY